jgi:hypothetical protein
MRQKGDDVTCFEEMRNVHNVCYEITSVSTIWETMVNMGHNVKMNCREIGL